MIGIGVRMGGMMKKTMTALVAGIVFVALTLAGCSTQENSSTSDVKKITYIILPTFGGTSEMWVLASDYSVKECEIGFDAEELPPDNECTLTEYRMSEEEWNALVGAINDNNFAELPEDLPAGADDVPFFYIQVETSDWVHKTGGYAAGFGDDDASKRFKAIQNELRSIIEKAQSSQPEE